MFSKLENQLELISLYPLVVQEGGVALVMAQNIDVVLDHHKYGVRPSGVLLHIVQPPQHGRIAIDLQRAPGSQASLVEGEGKRQVFTLLDLTRDKVCGIVL